MERKYFKALNFDLDTHQLKEYYPGTDYHHAYEDLRKFFGQQGFSHRQGSGYLSNHKMDSSEIYDLMDLINEKMPWMKKCVHIIDVTNVGNQYGLVELLKKSENLEIEDPGFPIVEH